MKKTSWTEVATGLQARNVSAGRRDADAFARDFAARARMVRQDGPESRQSVPMVWFKWSAVSVATVLVLLAGFIMWPSAGVNLVTHVKSLRVLAPHSGVIIMDDESGRGTVVWVTGMDSDGGNKG